MWISHQFGFAGSECHSTLSSWRSVSFSATILCLQLAYEGSRGESSLPFEERSAEAPEEYVACSGRFSGQGGRKAEPLLVTAGARSHHVDRGGSRPNDIAPASPGASVF